jgi:hypothetical protein
MKKQIKLITGIMLIGCLISSTSIIRAVVERTDKASNKESNFEIFNKTSKIIFVTLESADGNTILNKEPVLVRGKIRTTVGAVNRQFILNIWHNNRVITQSPDIKRGILAEKDRKTIFLTVDANGEVRPQTGTFMGWSGKTDSGLKLDKSKNISNDGITEEIW